MHTVREQPDDAPVEVTSELRLSRDAFCTYSSSGVLTVDKATITYGNSGRVESPWTSASTKLRFSGWGYVDLKKPTELTMHLNCTLVDATIITIVAGGYVVPPSTASMMLFMTEFGTSKTPSTDPEPDKMGCVEIAQKFTFDKQFNIAGGSIGPTPIGGKAEITAELKWEMIPATSAPTDDTPR